MEKVNVLLFFAFGLYLNHTFAIECSDIDVKVTNLVNDVSNITIDQKFAGSCAVVQESAKNQSWKVDIDKKIESLQRKKFDNLDDAYSGILVDDKVPDIELKYAAKMGKRSRDDKRLKEKIKSNEEKLKKIALSKSCVHNADFRLYALNGVETSDRISSKSKSDALLDINNQIQKIESQDGVVVCSDPTPNFSQLSEVANKVQFELGDDIFFCR